MEVKFQRLLAVGISLPCGVELKIIIIVIIIIIIINRFV